MNELILLYKSNKKRETRRLCITFTSFVKPNILLKNVLYIPLIAASASLPGVGWKEMRDGSASGIGAGGGSDINDGHPLWRRAPGLWRAFRSPCQIRVFVFAHVKAACELMCRWCFWSVVTDRYCASTPLHRGQRRVAGSHDPRQLNRQLTRAMGVQTDDDGSCTSSQPVCGVCVCLLAVSLPLPCRLGARLVVTRYLPGFNHESLDQEYYYRVAASAASSSLVPAHRETRLELLVASL